MIREAKGVALHDLSFWSNTLPLLEGLPRVLRDYQTQFTAGVQLSLTADTGRDLHDRTLDKFIELASGLEGAADPLAGRLATDLMTMMRSRSIARLPEAKVAIAGCGIVTGGSCDLLWQPLIVELN